MLKLGSTLSWISSSQVIPFIVEGQSVKKTYCGEKRSVTILIMQDVDYIEKLLQKTIIFFI